MKKCDGFSLVEILVVVALTVILLTFAAPNMASLLASNRVTEASNQLVSALNLARSEAIRQSNVVWVSRLQPEPADAGNWNSGWHLWIDANHNNKFDATVDVEIYSFATEKTEVRASNSQNAIQYYPTGYVKGIGGTSVLFSICSEAQGSVVALASSGFISVQNRQCAL